MSLANRAPSRRVVARQVVRLVALLAIGFGLTPFYHIPWWDLLTHSVAGAALAVLALTIRPRGWFALAAVLVIGPAWELAEWSAPKMTLPVLGRVYFVVSPIDTAVDLVCNLVGALVVVGLLAAYRFRLRRTGCPAVSV